MLFDFNSNLGLETKYLFSLHHAFISTDLKKEEKWWWSDPNNSPGADPKQCDLIAFFTPPHGNATEMCFWRCVSEWWIGGLKHMCNAFNFRYRSDECELLACKYHWNKFLKKWEIKEQPSLTPPSKYDSGYQIFRPVPQHFDPNAHGIYNGWESFQ